MQRGDRVLIEGLDIDTVIGVHDWERETRQRLRIDLEMDFDCRIAAASDKLEDALDYQVVANAATALVEASRCTLIEAVAERLAAMLLREFPLQRVRVQVRKPGAVANAASVGVCIERSRDP